MARDSLVGLVRRLRRSTVEAQIEALEAHGCTRIWDWDERAKLLRFIRGRGDIVVMTEAHCLGPSRPAAAALFCVLLDKGATVAVLRGELSSHTPKGAALIAFGVAAGLAGDSRALTTDEARAYGKRGAAAKQRDRTPFAVMRREWGRLAARGVPVDDRMSSPKLAGWTKSTIYREIAKAAKKPPNG